MSDIFISYAEEDRIEVHKIAELLKAKGFKPYFYTDPKLEGNLVIENIENALKKSKIFLIILSLDYLKSNWCKAEFDVAFLKEREAQTKGEEYRIYVLKVKETDTGDWVFERRYIQTDVTKIPFEEEVNKFIDSKLKKLPTEVNEEKFSRGWLPFQNRVIELHKLDDRLDYSDGPFRFIVAPPQMGKSWLLTQFSRSLLGQKKNWIIQHFDFQTHIEARTNIKELLKGLNFRIDGIGEDNVEGFCLAAAKQIGDKNWLLLMDSAEHINDNTARQFRSFLGGLRRRLEPVKGRIALVAASRTELVAFKGDIPKPSFEVLDLFPFSQSVIDAALRAVNEKPGAALNYQDISTRLLKLTEGLPELITRYLEWIRSEADFAFIPEDLENDIRCKEINKTYIENTLLSARVLLPYVPTSDVLEETRKAWADFVLKASSFRLITRSHIRHMRSEAVIDELPPLLKPSQDLLDAFGKLHLVIPTQAMWYQIAPAIRRLLFHYCYLSDTEKLKIHKKNEVLYKDWKNLSGLDVLSFTIEQFWHYVEQVRIELVTGQRLKHNVEDYFQSLCNDLKPNGESYFDQLVGLGNLVAKDEELTTSLEEIEPGLTEKLYKKIERLKEGRHES